MSVIYQAGKLSAFLLSYVALVLALCMCSVGCRTQGTYDGTAERDYFHDSEVVELCEAIASSNIEQVQTLATEKLVNICGEHGVTPAMWAVFHNSPQTLQLLLDRGADVAPSLSETVTFNTRRFEKGWAVIHIAAASDSPACLKVLLDSGVDPNTRDHTPKRLTPVFATLVLPNIDQHLRLLTEAGANLNIESGRSPPYEASAVYARFDHALALLEAGSDPKVEFPNGRRLVHLLVRAPIADAPKSQKQKDDYDALLKWLDAHGESVEKAKEDVASGRG